MVSAGNLRTAWLDSSGRGSPAWLWSLEMRVAKGRWASLDLRGVSGLFWMVFPCGVAWPSTKYGCFTCYVVAQSSQNECPKKEKNGSCIVSSPSSPRKSHCTTSTTLSLSRQSQGPRGSDTDWPLDGGTTGFWRSRIGTIGVDVCKHTQSVTGTKIDLGILVYLHIVSVSFPSL